MRHLFSTGEIMNHQNIKKLDIGDFVGEKIEYEKIEDDTWFICHGHINRKDVKLRIRLDTESMQSVAFRYRLGILMQSDILEGNWVEYAFDETS